MTAVPIVEGYAGVSLLLEQWDRKERLQFVIKGGLKDVDPKITDPATTVIAEQEAEQSRDDSVSIPKEVLDARTDEEKAKEEK